MFRFLVPLLVLLAALQLPAQAPAPAHSQTAKTADSSRTNSTSVPEVEKAPTAPSANEADSENLTSPASAPPQPRITVASPPAPPPVWSLQDRISWGANLFLAFLGYAGIMLALRTLRKIERQTKSGELLAQAALDSASTALLNAQSLLNAERPWILITVEPSQQVKNAFRIVATNRGRSAAEILATADRIGIVADEQHLPPTPEFTKEKPLAVHAILVPGESTVIQPFGREDVKWICKTEESLRRIELWQDTIFLYGRLVYRTLLAPGQAPTHQVNWCCKYVHGESASSLVMGGPPEYNKHSNLPTTN